MEKVVYVIQEMKWNTDFWYDVLEFAKSEDAWKQFAKEFQKLSGKYRMIKRIEEEMIQNGKNELLPLEGK